jgi:hypothetical protein
LLYPLERFCSCIFLITILESLNHFQIQFNSIMQHSRDVSASTPSAAASNNGTIIPLRIFCGCLVYYFPSGKSTSTLVPISSLLHFSNSKCGGRIFFPVVSVPSHTQSQSTRQVSFFTFLHVYQFLLTVLDIYSSPPSLLLWILLSTMSFPDLDGIIREL